MVVFRTAVVAVGVLIAVPSFAQDPPAPVLNPRVEVTVGYQGQFPVGSAAQDPSGSFTGSFGWISRGRSLGLLVVCDRLGVGTSDFAGTWFEYSVLAGPRLRLRAQSRVQPFAQALMGVMGSAGGPSASTQSNPSGTAFQVAPGAGVDLRVNRVFTLRLAQVEYRSFIGGNRADRFTVSTGVVLGLGARTR